MSRLEKICFYCSNAHVDDDGALHCVEKDGKVVKDEDTCEKHN